MELGVSHVQNLSSLPPIIDNIFDKYNKNLVPIRSLSDHDTGILFYVSIIMLDKRKEHQTLLRVETIKQISRFCL